MANLKHKIHERYFIRSILLSLSLRKNQSYIISLDFFLILILITFSGHTHRTYYMFVENTCSNNT